MMTATYDPGDNKLRLSSTSRLDTETYNRVKAVGFRWAPKQDIFVAPMWTPEREDLLIELCGEIGDEDTSLVDRAEERADRFDGYRENRAEDAARAHKAVSAIADGIPLGQPILIGHHSEKHARRDAEKIENGMRRAVKMWETSEYWKYRAAGAIRHAKYKELPAVRARRIKGLESDRRKQERFVKDAETALSSWEKVAAMPEGEQEHAAIQVAGNSICGWLRMPRKEGDRQDWDQHCDAYSGLTHSYPSLYAKRTPGEVIAAARRAYPSSIARHQRWIQHYDNRLEYERAMLADGGGIATDRTNPEKGGAVRCWATRGGWAYIQKANRVSVSILDNWGRGDHGANFTRTIPFDKLQGVMSAAAVQEARDTGRLLEREDKTGFLLTDTKSPEPPPAAPAPEANVFDAMKETLRAGVQVVSAPQLFPTPPELAARMVDLAGVGPSDEVLEPSAGTGVILEAIRRAGAKYFAVELNHRLAEVLSQRFATPEDAAQGMCRNVLQADFLECNGNLGTFDAILMNPPFANAEDIKHIRHAMHMLKPGGRLVAICANGPRQREQLMPLVDEWEDLPADTFKESGTSVNTALLRFTA